jgi:hypothetical protein
MPASESEVLVGRRYLDRGFLDAAMKLFIRNADRVTAADWTTLGDCLMESHPRRRQVCELGGCRFRERISFGDLYLRRNHRRYDPLVRAAGADRDRWARLLDALTVSPDRERQRSGWSAASRPGPAGALGGTQQGGQVAWPLGRQWLRRRFAPSLPRQVSSRRTAGGHQAQHQREPASAVATRDRRGEGRADDRVRSTIEAVGLRTRVELYTASRSTTSSPAMVPTSCSRCCSAPR